MHTGENTPEGRYICGQVTLLLCAVVLPSVDWVEQECLLHRVIVMLS